jgi:uncharacterized membrane protein
MDASQAFLQMLVPMLLIAIITTGIAVRFVGAIFSQRVRNSIARHRLAHTLWLVASVFAILVLIAWLYPCLANRPRRGANQRPAADARQNGLFVFEDPRSGTSQVERLGGLLICAR